MLLDSAFGDLWMPLAVFVTLGVTFGIGLSRLLRCTLLHCRSGADVSLLLWDYVQVAIARACRRCLRGAIACARQWWWVCFRLTHARVTLCSGANKETTLIVSLLWIVYNMIPPYLLIHYTFIGRGSTLNFMSKCGTLCQILRLHALCFDSLLKHKAQCAVFSNLHCDKHRLHLAGLWLDKPKRPLA